MLHPHGHTVLGSPQHSSLISLVSWKTEVVIHVSSIVNTSYPHPKGSCWFKKLRNCMGGGLSDWIVGMDYVVGHPNLIAQSVSGDDSDRGLEIFVLEYDPVQFQTVCFLRLPQFLCLVGAIPEVSFSKE